MLFFHLYKITFFYFLCFSLYNNVYPKYCQSDKKRCQSMKSGTLSLKTIRNKLLLKQLLLNEALKKDLLLLPNKLIEKIPDPRNAKEHYQSFIRKKNRKSVKQSEMITYQPKTFENPSIVNIKSVIIEHPKTSYKL